MFYVWLTTIISDIRVRKLLKIYLRHDSGEKGTLFHTFREKGFAFFRANLEYEDSFKKYPPIRIISL